MAVRVGVNGYGTIGKRVADAVAAQDDMELVGVTKTRPDYVARMAVARGYGLYVAKEENIPRFEKSRLPVAGGLADLLERVDVIVDATPGGIGAEYKLIYDKVGVKAIFQGGEKHIVTGFSFNALVNYDEAKGRDYVRVVSCNTTGLIRTLWAVHSRWGIEKARAVLVRRGADPPDVKKGPINAITPHPPTVPSHHGPDVQTVIPDIDIDTMAVDVPTTLMHAHAVMLRTRDEPSADEVRRAFEDTPRVILVEAEDGIKSTAQIIEMGRDLLRPRYDVNEIAVWSESIYSGDNDLYYLQAVHQEANVVPENVDAIRAMMEIEDDAMRSIEKTDRTMGIC